MQTMRKIWISDEVWDAIATHGKFGETEDVVLRRLLNLSASRSGSAAASDNTTSAHAPPPRPRGWKERRATDTMWQTVQGNELTLKFATGATKKWTLPAKNNRAAIRTVRDDAVAWARENGATEGQKAAVMRALTHNGWHVKSRPEDYA